MTDQKRKMKPVKAWLPVDVKTGIASMPPCPTEELAVSSIQLMKMIDDREFRIAVVEIREVEVRK